MSQQKPKKIQKEKLLEEKIKDFQQTLSSKDTILYALGIGYSVDPLNNQDLEYTYENHGEFKVFPTLGTVIPQKGSDMIDVFLNSTNIPEFNPMGLLHGEQRLEMYKPILTDINYTIKTKIVDVLDKKSGALFVIQQDSLDDQQQLAFRNYSYIFVKGLGGFQQQQQQQLYSYKMEAVPQRNADIVVEQKTNANQAILYRLNGDFNPLHIDPEMAKMGNFDKPILHGLCTYGLVAKCFVQSMPNKDQNLLKVIHSRFTSHVFPGETLIISFWKLSNNLYVFSAHTKERQKQVIVGNILTNHIKESPKL